MKIGRHTPPPPQREFTLTFPEGEGWAIVAALREYADNHPEALQGKNWKRWSADLDDALRNR